MDIIEKHERVVFVIWEPLRSVLLQKYKRIDGRCSAMVGCLELKRSKIAFLSEIVVFTFLPSTPREDFPAKTPPLQKKILPKRELHG